MFCVWSQAYISSRGIIVWCVCVCVCPCEAHFIFLKFFSFSSSNSCHFQTPALFWSLEKVCADEREEIERLGSPSEPPLYVDKHDSVFDCLLQPFIHTITVFIQLTDNEQADLGLFTLCICFTQREIRVSLPGCSASCMCRSSVYKQEWSAVMVALFAQGLMPSVWMCLAGQALILFSQRGDWKWWKTQTANWSSLTQLLGRKMEGWKRAREKEEGNRKAPIK